MAEISPIYWMIIIGAVVLMFCFVLYYIAMLLKESRDVVRDSRAIIQNADEIMKQSLLIVSDVQESVSMLKGTVATINESVVAPIKRIGNIITMVGDFVDGLKRR